MPLVLSLSLANMQQTKCHIRVLCALQVSLAERLHCLAVHVGYRWRGVFGGCIAFGQKRSAAARSYMVTLLRVLRFMYCALKQDVKGPKSATEENPEDRAA